MISIASALPFVSLGFCGAGFAPPELIVRPADPVSPRVCNFYICPDCGCEWDRLMDHGGEDDDCPTCFAQLIPPVASEVLP
jgi:hypothetical protein